MDKFHCGYVVEVKKLEPHSNADRMQIATFFGNKTCVSLETKIGDIGIYFPTDLQLSERFCEENKLLRKDGGFIDNNKRNVTTIKLRGEKSDGIYMPIKCLNYLGVNLKDFKPGDIISEVNGEEICKKYIPMKRNSGMKSSVNAQKKEKLRLQFPFFEEHVDTPQLAYSENLFKPNDFICVTEKVHGTSLRVANTLKKPEDKWYHKFFKPKSKYEFVVGSRRLIMDDLNDKSNIWVKKGLEFKDRLQPGEEVYAEIVGFSDVNQPIMARCDNKKTKDKAFIKRYGNQTTFSYGCSEEKGESKVLIYRMTYTTPEGVVIEYPWDYVKLRAEMMGFDTVPELERFVFTSKEDMMDRIEKYMDLSSTLDDSHIIEGIVVRDLTAANEFKVAKHKSFNFKVLESIIKVSAEAPDLEESQEEI